MRSEPVLGEMKIVPIGGNIVVLFNKLNNTEQEYNVIVDDIIQKLF